MTAVSASPVEPRKLFLLLESVSELPRLQRALPLLLFSVALHRSRLYFSASLLVRIILCSRVGGCGRDCGVSGEAEGDSSAKTDHARHLSSFSLVLMSVRVLKGQGGGCESTLCLPYYTAANASSTQAKRQLLLLIAEETASSSFTLLCSHACRSQGVNAAPRGLDPHRCHLLAQDRFRASLVLGCRP